MMMRNTSERSYDRKRRSKKGMLRRLAILAVIIVFVYKVFKRTSKWIRRKKIKPRPVLMSKGDCAKYVETFNRSNDKACKRKQNLKNFSSYSVAANDKEVLSSILEEWKCESLKGFGDASSPNSHALCGFEYLDIIPDCLVLSYSIGRVDDSFERALQKTAPKCDIHRFDAAALELNDDGFHVYPWALSGTGIHGGPSVPHVPKESFMSFADSIHRIAREGRRIDVLVIDCIGCEWSVMTKDIFKMISNDELLVGQLLVKLYIKEKQKETVANLLEAADKAEMKLFRTEMRGACTDAKCWEYSFIADWWAADAHGVKFCPDRVGPMPQLARRQC